MNYKQIWETLSKINVNEHCKLLQGLKYLSWSWAWGVLMEHYPDATYSFGETVYEKDGSATVFCVVQIGDCRREMWLPVMTGGRHAAITSPTSRDISDAKMRCLVKCLAMYGLGFYIYAGEDLPAVSEPVEADPPKAAFLEREATKNELIDQAVEIAGHLKQFHHQDHFIEWVQGYTGERLKDKNKTKLNAMLLWLNEHQDLADWPESAVKALRDAERAIGV